MVLQIDGGIPHCSYLPFIENKDIAIWMDSELKKKEKNNCIPLSLNFNQICLSEPPEKIVWPGKTF